jgi:hypothetical protein
MRSAFIALICLAAACSDAAQEPTSPASQAARPTRPMPARPQPRPSESPFAETPTLEQAVAFATVPTSVPDSGRVRQMPGREAADYIAVIETERPVSHHHYRYEQRRSGDWIADVWRSGDGTRETISYFNARTGATVEVARDTAGEIAGVTIEQRDDYSWDRSGPTGEHGVHLGERCDIWRTIPRPPGSQLLTDTCLTADGVALYSRTFSTGHPTMPDSEINRVELSSLSRQRVDPALARPPREVFDWAYWQARAASVTVVAPASAPPNHTIWYQETREADHGRVILAQYRNGGRSELSHAWHSHGSEHSYSLEASGLNLRAVVRSGTNTHRSLRISLSNAVQGWRPDPATVERAATPEIILARPCYWLTPRNPPHDAWWQSCWTEDNFVLAREHGGRGGRSGEVAVRLTPGAPRALTPPPQIFTWAREMRD